MSKSIINLYNLDNQKWKNQFLNKLKQKLLVQLKANKINISIYSTNRKQDLNNIKAKQDTNDLIILLTSNLDVGFIMEALSKVDDVCSINKDVEFISRRVLKICKDNNLVKDDIDE